MGKRIPKETEIGFLNNVYYLYYAKLISHLIGTTFQKKVVIEIFWFFFINPKEHLIK
jgi:hypothetical protein